MTPEKQLQPQENNKAAAQMPRLETLYQFPYKVEDGCLCIQQMSKQSMVPRKLSNFLAWITTQITRTDGIDTKVYIKLRGVHSSGRPLPEIEIPFSELASFNWLGEKWGVDCILSVGSSVRDHMRFAIQQTGVHVGEQVEYATTGWRMVDGVWEYLMPGDVKHTVTLPGKLGGYSMVEDTRKDMREQVSELRAQTKKLIFRTTLLTMAVSALVCVALRFWMG